MCTMRVTPNNMPSASNTGELSKCRPATVSSYRLNTVTSDSDFALAPIALVVGPGMGSAQDFVAVGGAVVLDEG